MVYRENAYKGDVLPSGPRMVSFELNEVLVVHYRGAKRNVDSLETAVADTEKGAFASSEGIFG